MPSRRGHAGRPRRGLQSLPLGRLHKAQPPFTVHQLQARRCAKPQAPQGRWHCAFHQLCPHGHLGRGSDLHLRRRRRLLHVCALPDLSFFRRTACVQPERNKLPPRRPRARPPSAMGRRIGQWDYASPDRPICGLVCIQQVQPCAWRLHSTEHVSTHRPNVISDRGDAPFAVARTPRTGGCSLRTSTAARSSRLPPSLPSLLTLRVRKTLSRHDVHAMFSKC